MCEYLCECVHTLLTLYTVFLSVVDCRDPGTPENSQRELTTTTYNSIVSYRCIMGYVLRGVSERSCEANGRWSQSPPSCVPVDCEDPGSPQNSVRSLSATTLGNKVVYKCVEGYRLVGESMRECLKTGRWSHSLPSCVRKWWLITGVNMYIHVYLVCYKQSYIHTSTQTVQAHKQYKHTDSTSTQTVQAHRQYKHTDSTSTQTVQAHRQYKHTDSTSTQTVQAHKQYKHTDSTSTQTVQAHKQYKHTDSTSTQTVQAHSHEQVSTYAQTHLLITLTDRTQ